MRAWGLFGGACVLAWAGCEVWGLLIPLRREPFSSYMTRRAARGVGRIAVALGVVVAGVAFCGGAASTALAAAAGALLGWLLVAGREAWQEQRKRP